MEKHLNNRSDVELEVTHSIRAGSEGKPGLGDDLEGLIVIVFWPCHRS